MTYIYVGNNEPTPRMVQALIPEAPTINLMQMGAHVPLELKPNLTAAHEGGHAVLGAVLCGVYCEYAATKPGPGYAGGAAVLPLNGEAPDPGENVALVDLAGLYAELHFMKGDTTLAWAHVENAKHDLRSIMDRKRKPGWRASRWAKSYGATTRVAVSYFWPAVEAVAAALLSKQRIERDEIEQLVVAHRPTTPTPRRLTKRLKPEFVIAATRKRR